MFLFVPGFILVYLITTELYPTNLRSQAVGSASTISRIFCAFAPQLGPLAKYWKPLPMLVIGVPILISGALALKLPESFNEELPQTMRKAEEMKEKRSNVRVTSELPGNYPELPPQMP